MTMDESTILKELGLSSNEVKVYLASLSLGSSPANSIAKQASLLRTSTYEILKSLADKGIVSHVMRGRVKHFEATSPDRLLQLLEERKERFQQVLPKLMKMRHSIIEKPSVELYEGKNGLKTILEDVLRNAEYKYFVIGNNTRFRSLLPDYFRRSFLQRRLNSNIVCERIAEESKETNELQKVEMEEKRVTKKMPGLEKANAEIFVYGNRIAIFTLVHNYPMGIVVKEKNIADLFRIIFNDLWNQRK